MSGTRASLPVIWPLNRGLGDGALGIVGCVGGAIGDCRGISFASVFMELPGMPRPMGGGSFRPRGSQRRDSNGQEMIRMVGAGRFERPTPCAQGRCATRLRYAPTVTDCSKKDLATRARFRKGEGARMPSEQPYHFNAITVREVHYGTAEATHLPRRLADALVKGSVTRRHPLCRPS